MVLYIYSASGTLSQRLIIVLNISFFISITELEHISHILKNCSKKFSINL